MCHADRWKVVELNLSDLSPHPHQQEFFPGTNEAEDTSLAEDFKIRGQQNPIEVVPDGERSYAIVTGHRRAAIAKALGWETIRAIVRYDLGSADSLESMEHFIADNSGRRQLSDFERAKCAVTLKEIAEERKRGRKLTKSQATTVRESVRESIGKTLEIGPRQVSRLLRVFETPTEVQEAMRWTRSH